MDRPATTPLLIACGVLALAAMGFLAKSAVTRRASGAAETRVSAARREGNDPYSRQSGEYATAPVRFQTMFARDAAASLRRNTPDGTFEVADRAVVDDTGSALRITVQYSGDVPAPDGHAVRVRGHLREYIHPYGMVTLDSTCASDYSMCLRYDGLVAEADRAILAHVGESDLENLVPAASDCEKRQFDLGAQVRLVAVCRFDDVVLTFQRLGLGAANLELMRRAQDPGDRPAPSRDH